MNTHIHAHTCMHTRTHTPTHTHLHTHSYTHARTPFHLNSIITYRYFVLFFSIQFTHRDRRSARALLYFFSLIHGVPTEHLYTSTHTHKYTHTHTHTHRRSANRAIEPASGHFAYAEGWARQISVARRSNFFCLRSSRACTLSELIQLA